MDGVTVPMARPYPPIAAENPTAHPTPNRGRRRIEVGDTGDARVVEQVPFSFTVEPEGTTTVLRVTGEFDILGAVALRDALGLVALDGTDAVRVDCAGLTFMDSTAVTVLLELRDRVVTGGGRFSVVALPPAQRDLLARAGLLTHLQPDG